MKKTFHKVCIAGMYFNAIKTVYDKLTATMILGSENLKAVTPGQGTKCR